VIKNVFILCSLFQPATCDPRHILLNKTDDEDFGEGTAKFGNDIEL